jgi:hypothetical protein
MSRMLEMLRDLVAHKGHANAALLNAIRQNTTAASDPELWELLHHILLANRFWLLTVLGLPFVHEDEARPFRRTDPTIRQYSGAGDHVARDRHGGRPRTDSGRRSHSAW